MIYLDMDGVLADFDAWLLARGIVNKTNFIHKPREEWTPEEHELDKKVVACMEEPNFFYSLPVMHGAVDLWNKANELDQTCILTARPKDASSALRVREEKLAWCHENLPDFDSHRFFCVTRHQKQDFAVTFNRYGEWGPETSHTLVDDLIVNCEEWGRAGGKAILYRNAPEAIKELENLYWAL